MSNGYETHLRLLTKHALAANPGDTICELGCGYYSSPVLYSICEALNLRFVVYYSDPTWQKQVATRLGSRMEWIKVDNWETWQPTEPAHLYLLDNEQLVVNRFQTLHKIRPFARVVAVHDADTYIKRGVPLQNSFAVLETDSSSLPHTSIVQGEWGIQKAILAQPVPTLPTVAVVPTATAVVPVQATPATPQLASTAPGKVAVVCAFVPGGDYDTHYREYVQKLSDGLNLTPNRPDFFCMTVMTLEGVTGVKQLTPLNNFKGWHIKGEVFNPSVWSGYDRVLYVDLDTVIRGDITNLLSEPAQFGLLRDFNKPSILETGIIWFDPSITGSLYSMFVNHNPSVRVKDADLVNTWLNKQNLAKDVVRLQDKYCIGSYKISLLKAGKPAEDFDIVCFHGQPRPHHVNWSLEVTAGARVSAGGKVKYDVKAVPRLWPDSTVFIIGGGPSVNDLDLSVLNNRNVIGVNDAFMFPCAKVCYFGDTSWEGHHQQALAEWGKPIFTTSGVQRPHYHHLDMIPSGMSAKPTEIGWNKNSGYAAINLACHLGAKRIYLVGFDMSFRNGESNYHKNIRKVHSDTYKVFLRAQTAMANGLKGAFPGVEVINLESADGVSKLTAFPKQLFSSICPV